MLSLVQAMEPRISMLYLVNSTRRGRGVCTSSRIRSGDVIERCPVIIIPAQELPALKSTVLYDYYFMWDRPEGSAAIVLGFGALYNHSSSPNADIILNYEELLVEFIATQDIARDCEITFDYGELWDADRIQWNE